MAWTPLVVGVIYLVAMQSLGVGGALDKLADAVGMNFGELSAGEAGGLTTMVVLVLVSIGLWPMALLVVAVGGLPALIRVDLMLRTMVRSFTVYSIVVVLAYAGLLIPELIGALLMPGEVVEESSLETGWLQAAILAPLSLYGQIFMMRTVGLFYHHFKSRFAWSWG